MNSSYPDGMGRIDFEILKPTAIKTTQSITSPNPDFAILIFKYYINIIIDQAIFKGIRPKFKPIKATQAAPRAAELYLYLGNAHTLSRDYQKGLNAYNKVIELAPDTPLAQEAKEKATLIKNLNPKWAQTKSRIFFKGSKYMRGRGVFFLKHYKLAKWVIRF